jgi:hypothetical protein
MSWPSITDYQGVIQSPSTCLSDTELKCGTIVLNHLGLPKPNSGKFAIVYQMICNSGKYAVRCFQRHIPDQEHRYSLISNHLQQNKLPYISDFEFLKQGIRVKGIWYPILKMKWIEGEQLNTYVEKNLNKRQILESLACKFFQLISELKRCSIAHGDLQHRNILISNGDFRLIDYDGMYVPALKGFQSHELGLGNYQHPSRTGKDFDLHLDNFSAWVIYISLLALSKEPGLWHKFGCGDEFLLFEKSDFENPYTSAKFTELQQVKDNDFNSIFLQFKSLINCNDISQIPPVKPITPIVIGIPSITKAPEQPLDDSWVWDHKQIQPQHLNNSLVIERLLPVGIIIFLGIGSLSSWFSSVGAFLLIVLLSFLSYISFLGFRFKYFPQELEKKKLQSENKIISKDIKQIGNYLNILQKDKDHLSQEYSKEENKIKLQLQDCQKKEAEEITKIEGELRDLIASFDMQKNNLIQAEKDELNNELNAFQNRFFANRLSQYSLVGAGIQGIGTEMTSRLLHEGIKTAADIANIHITQHGFYMNEVAHIILSNGRKVHVSGIGPVKAKALLAWRRSLESQFQQYMPKSLPTALEGSIKSKYSSQYQSLDLQRNNAPINTQNKKNSIKSKYVQERNNLSKQLQDVNKIYIQDNNKIEDKVAKQKKLLSEKQWSFNKIKREYDAYKHVSFISYLKRIIFISS